MNKNKPTLIAILASIFLIITFIADIGGAYSAWLDFVCWISKNTSLKLNDYTTKFLLFIIIVVLITILFQLMTLLAKTDQPLLLDEKKIRENYLNWFGNYVKNRLNSSIHTALFIYLNKKEELGKVEPWTYQYQETNLQGREELNIIDDFLVRIEKNRGRILLLGAPGCGKTTTLFKIADLLYEKALKDQEKPIPILLNLSTWGNVSDGKVLFDKKSQSAKYLTQDKNPDIETWITGELVKIKGLLINYQIAKKWIDEKNFIILLDGLDEAKEVLRAKLVDKLNEFFLIYPQTTIVCSRIEDYNALIESNSTKLNLDAAITIQPLSDEQIEEYLDKTKAKVVKRLIREDSELFKIARIPLNLSIMVFTYDENYFPDKSNNLISGTLLRLDLFSKFVKKMVEWKELRAISNIKHPETKAITKQDVPREISEKIIKKEEKVNKYLSWIAKRMSETLENSFRSNDMYYYIRNYNEKSVWNPMNITIGLLLFILSFCLTFIAQINTFHLKKEYTLFLIPFLIPFYYYFFIVINNYDNYHFSFVKKKKTRDMIHNTGSWFIILAIFIYIFGGLNFLSSNNNLGTIIGIILTVIINGINLINKVDNYTGFRYLKKEIWWNLYFLSAFVISIIYFNEPTPFVSIFLTLIIVMFFLILENEYLQYVSIIIFVIALVSYIEPKLSAIFLLITTTIGLLIFLIPSFNIRMYLAPKYNIDILKVIMKILFEPLTQFTLKIKGSIPFNFQNFINW